jgi:hypothetical protein
VIVFGELSFSFENLNKDSRLVISISGKDLRFFGWDSGVSRDKNSHNSSSSFDTHGKRGNIEKK